ncbi:MAG: pseudouridine synthase [Bacteroidota bacterium]
MVDIIYQDDHLVAINKPTGLAVHRSYRVADAEIFALQLVRDAVGRRVNLVHRLDRKTSGVLLFSFDKITTQLVQKAFVDREVGKRYIAIVRGFITEAQQIDYPLRSESGNLQNAVSNVYPICKTEIAVPFGKWPTSRYSLVEVIPTTGRLHQIRRHLAHINHPIIGDRPHGCNKQNRLFKERWNMTEMLLHASELSLSHPHTGNSIVLKAPPLNTFTNMMTALGLRSN